MDDRGGASGVGTDRHGAGTALLVVDVQVASVRGGLWRADRVLQDIAALLDACRAHGVEVVHVQDDGAPGSPYEPGSEGWAFHPIAAPLPGERVVRKRSNSAFLGTDLAAWLRTKGLGSLVVVGLHTEYCFDTTVRAAFEHGFRVVVPETANSTFDRPHLSAEAIHRHHNRHIFAGRFARVCSLDEALTVVRQAGDAG